MRRSGSRLLSPLGHESASEATLFQSCQSMILGLMFIPADTFDLNLNNCFKSVVVRAAARLLISTREECCCVSDVSSVCASTVTKRNSLLSSLPGCCSVFLKPLSEASSSSRKILFHSVFLGFQKQRQKKHLFFLQRTYFIYLLYLYINGKFHQVCEQVCNTIASQIKLTIGFYYNSKRQRLGYQTDNMVVLEMAQQMNQLRTEGTYITSPVIGSLQMCV